MTEEKSTLLIVEDDVDVAEMLTAYFRAQGYEVLAVNWGEDAVKTCRTGRPDLVILDIRLPDIDGFEVARRLRANQRTQDIPIIFLTEKREREDRLQGLELGADDYITKPFDIQELRLRVRNSLRRTEESSLTNPVTGMPEGGLVDEKLRECLTGPECSLIKVAIENIGGFREAYGFVAADDVQRAVSMMIHNAMRDVGGTGDFIGHLGQTEFVLVTQQATLPALVERIRSRLEQSLEYFYPLRDRGGSVSGRLRVQLGVVTGGSNRFKGLDELKKALDKAQVK